MPSATSSTFARTPEVNRKREYADGHEFVDPEEQDDADYRRNMKSAQPFYKKIGLLDEPSNDYPLGGSIEPYDIETENELTA
jgi:hypothetical protein